MRIKLKKPIKFFDEILNKEKSTLNQFSKMINENYSNLKKYRRGDLLIPERLFNKLIRYSPNKSHWIKNLEKFENNWGKIKAGIVSAKDSKSKLRAAYARKFIKRPKINIKINEFFCEFYGTLLGDGCISKFKDCEGAERIGIFISGNKKLDSEYLTYLKKRLKEEFNINSYFYQHKTKNICTLTIKNKGFSLFLKKFGFPIGKKYNKIKIPKKLLKLPWKVKKFVIRGLFDTDGSICAKKREKYKYPQICITSIDNRLIKQIYDLLRKQNYPCWIGGDNIFIRSSEATKRWFNDIGSSNNRNIFKYKYWLKNKILSPNLLGS